MEQETQTPTGSQPELTLVDLQNLKAVVEVAAKRGAFAANEMSAVGAVFDKLSAFLTAAAPPQQPATEATETAQQPE